MVCNTCRRPSCGSGVVVVVVVVAVIFRGVCRGPGKAMYVFLNGVSVTPHEQEHRTAAGSAAFNRGHGGGGGPSKLAHVLGSTSRQSPLK